MADLSITAANVLRSSTGSEYLGVAGAAITQGQVCYLDTATNTVKLADADGASQIIKTVKGIALNAASTGQPIALCTKDTAGFAPGATTTEGVIYVLSGTPGGIAPAADLTSAWDVQIIGVGMPSNKIRLEIVNSAQTLA
jgi:hypothetical protein